MNVTSLSKVFGMALTVLLPSAHVHGSPLVTYGFDSNKTIFDAKSTAAQVSAGELSSGAGASLPAGTSAIAERGRAIRFANEFIGGKEEIAINNNRYLSFTVKIDEGSTLDISGLSFYALRRVGGEFSDEGRGAPQAFSVRSSLDDFATKLFEGAIPGSENNDFILHSVDFSKDSSLREVSGEVTFRIYFWTPETTGGVKQRVWRFDELVLSGEVNGLRSQ